MLDTDKTKSADGKVYHILVVDDEKEGLNALRMTFERNKQFKCKVSIANNAEEALGLLENHPFDLVLSDFKMPGMDGIELLTHVRQNYPGTIRMLITAYSDLRIAVKAINKAEINNYIEKPWSNQELVTIVHASLKRKSERQLLEKREYDNVMDALEAVRKLQDDMSRPARGGMVPELTRMTFEFTSPREFNRFSFEIRRLGNVSIEDVYVFENKYLVIITAYPHSYMSKTE